MDKIIPLFPLRLVVFPSSRYMLRIFEERYKKMVEFVKTKENGFGIINFSDDKENNIGTFVRIVRYDQVYENGDFDIVVEGVQRIKVHDRWFHPDGYYLGTTSAYADNEDDKVDSMLIDQLKMVFEEIIEKTDFELKDNFWSSYESAEYKAFKIAEKSGLNLRQQQTLLNLQTEEDRIFYLINHFQKLSALLSGKAQHHKLVLHDGYLDDLDIEEE